MFHQMKIAILGSTGFVGGILINKAIKQGYQVKTLARRPEKLQDIRDKVEIIEGSIFDYSVIEKTIQGTEAVLSTVGPPPGKQCDPVLYQKTMMNIVDIMNKNGVKRYIHIGGAVHLGGKEEIWSVKRKFLRVFLKLLSKQILIAKQLEWEVLKASNLDWTLIRPPRISKGMATGKISADDKKPDTLSINVDDLTDFMLAQISSQEWFRTAPLVSNI